MGFLSTSHTLTDRISPRLDIQKDSLNGVIGKLPFAHFTDRDMHGAKSKARQIYESLSTIE